MRFLWKGKPDTELSRDELIEIILQQGKDIQFLNKKTIALTLSDIGLVTNDELNNHNKSMESIDDK